MLMHIEKSFAKSGRNTTDAPAGWTEDGKVFFILDKTELDKRWLPLFFPQAKFSSFTRKLYRWGFRQVSVGPESRVASKKGRGIFFYNEHFQRDEKHLLPKMRSTSTPNKGVAMSAQYHQTLPARAEAVGQQGVGTQEPGMSRELAEMLASKINSTDQERTDQPDSAQPPISQNAALLQAIAAQLEAQQQQQQQHLILQHQLSMGRPASTFPISQPLQASQTQPDLSPLAGLLSRPSQNTSDLLSSLLPQQTNLHQLVQQARQQQVQQEQQQRNLELLLRSILGQSESLAPSNHDTRPDS